PLPSPPSSTLLPYTTLFRSNPISTLDRDLINKSGQGTTTEELLKNLPIASANSIPVQNNAIAPGGPPARGGFGLPAWLRPGRHTDRKSTRLNSSHRTRSYAV